MCFFRRTKKYRPVPRPQASGTHPRTGDVPLLGIGAGSDLEIGFEGVLRSAVSWEDGVNLTTAVGVNDRNGSQVALRDSRGG